MVEMHPCPHAWRPWVAASWTTQSSPGGKPLLGRGLCPGPTRVAVGARPSRRGRGQSSGLLVVLLSSGRVALHHRRGLRSSVQPREWGALSTEPRMDTAWGRGRSVSSLQVSTRRGPLPCGRCVGRVDSQLLGGTCSGRPSVAAGDAQTRSVPVGALSPCTYRPPGVDV